MKKLFTLLLTLSLFGQSELLAENNYETWDQIPGISCREKPEECPKGYYFTKFVNGKRETGECGACKYDASTKKLYCFCCGGMSVAALSKNQAKNMIPKLPEGQCTEEDKCFPSCTDGVSNLPPKTVFEITMEGSEDPLKEEYVRFNTDITNGMGLKKSLELIDKER